MTASDWAPQARRPSLNVLIDQLILELAAQYGFSFVYPLVQ
jgi:hypothetical protein